MYTPLTKSMLLTILPIVILNTTGCARQELQVADQTLVLPSGKKARTRMANNYQGHNDGCESASGHWQRDSYRWKRYRTYRKAWRFGYKTCS